MSGTQSELAPSEVLMSEGLSVMPDDEEEEIEPAKPSFPPYPPYATKPAPPSVADAIIAGHGLRLLHKSKARKSVRPLPRPAKPRGPKATDVKMSRKALWAHARCLRRHGAILTDRLEYMSKPRRRHIIYLWRENADILPAWTIARLRSMLDADEPFKPDQAYEYFVNLKKTKKRAAATAGVRALKKDMIAMCGEKQFAWARNATVAFARGIQKRLSRPGRYSLADGMLRLSDIIMHDICGYMRIKTPSRRCTNPKAKFMMEMSDKIAVWIDEILSESDDRMLMMDFDEDDEVARFYEDKERPEGEPHAKDRSGDSTPTPGLATTPASPAVTPKTPSGTPASGAATPPPTTPPPATPGDQTPKNVMFAARALTEGGTDGGGPGAPGGDGKPGVQGPSRSRVLTLPAYLKFQGNMKKAFEILTNSMDAKGDEQLISLGKFTQTYREGAVELKRTTDFQAMDYNTQEAEKLNKNLTDLTKTNTPPEIAGAMKDIINICSDYLAQHAEYNKEKGPAFKLLVSEMKKVPNDRMYEKGKIKKTNGQAARELELAQGLETDHDDPNLSQEIHSAMKRIVSRATPPDLKKDMDETLDVASKYLSQKAVDDNERGPAFNLLINELNSHGHEHFSDYTALSNRHAAAHVLKSAPGLGSVDPDPKTVPMFKAALHKAVDTATPNQMKDEMKRVVDLCSNYLSAFIRDRGAAMDALLNMMKSNPKNVFAKRNAYTMDYATGAYEVENAPALIPFLPIKDIADEGKANLTRDMKDVTPPALKIPMQVLIQDVSKHLSQLVALNSGVAGERYKMNFLSAVKKTWGSKPLYKYKNFGKTYSDAADELLLTDSASLPNLTDSVTNLGHEIHSEWEKSMPEKLTPAVVEGLKPTMSKASKHLGKIGTQKGKAMEYMVGLMKDKGTENLGKLQGYEQTYNDGARRLDNTSTLKSSTVDMGAYKSVKDKLTTMTQQSPNANFTEVLPDLIDDSANFLAKPVPETNAEKKQVLADLMARQGGQVLAEKESYKLSYEEGGEDIKDSPVGVTQAHDAKKNQEMVKKIKEVMPDKNMERVLKETTAEGAAYLTDVVEGRGQALEIIKDSLKAEDRKQFIDVGSFKKDHRGVADILSAAPNLKSDKPSPVILENVEHRFDVLAKDAPKDKPMAGEHMKSMIDIASKFIASKATKESGLNAAQLAALNAQGFNAEARAAAEARRLAAMGAGSDDKVLAGTSVSAVKVGRSEAGGLGGVDGTGGPGDAGRPGGGPSDVGGLSGPGDVGGPGGPGGMGGPSGPGDVGGPGGPGGMGGPSGPGDVGGPGGPGGMGGPSGPGLAGETEEERLRRLMEAEEYRKHEQEEQRRLKEAENLRLQAEQAEYLRQQAEQAEYLRQQADKGKAPRTYAAGSRKYHGGALGADYDPEHLAALDILHQELKAHGPEILYKQPQTTLTHGRASDLLGDPSPMKVDNSVKDSSDTARLHKKFERKLNTLVKDKTPEDLSDCMQDVVIEASRKLSEYFVTMNYNTLVKDGLVAEMQKRGNEILVEVDGAAETYFFAAQRIKRKDPAAAEQEPCYHVANEIGKKLDDMVRSRPMPRKLSMKMKDQVKETSKFLSASVTKPDDYIENYVALLAEMEAAGENSLIDGEIPKTYKKSANYLRQLTTYQDTIGLPNQSMKDQTQRRLGDLMAQAPPSEMKRNSVVMKTVIADSAGLLVSYVMLQAARSKALDVLVKEMEDAGEGALLRHGPIRKSFKDGADLLEGKTTDQLGVSNADPVVARKIQIKLNSLMQDNTPDAFKGFMAEVIEDATKYLAVHLLEPRLIKVCKCYKNVFVQCELWCEEMLRRISRPCCTCSRHVSVQALQDLAPADFLRVSADQSHVFAPGVEISIKPCPATQPTKKHKRKGPTPECSAQRPTTSYLLYATAHKRYGYDSVQIPSPSTSSSAFLSPTSPELSISPMLTGNNSPLRSLLLEMHADNAQHMREQQEEMRSSETRNENLLVGETPASYDFSSSSYNYGASAQSQPVRDPSQQSSTQSSESSKITTANSSAGYNSRTPIISGEHMVDWEATMVSLMWNVLAWRDWIQEVVDRALAYEHKLSLTRAETAISWLTFNRRISTEGIQWRQYSVFSRQLTTHLHLQYKDKEIMTANSGNINTETYIECQKAMLDIIDMFNRWTQWLTLVVKETDSLQQLPGSEIPLQQMRWNHLKKKVEEYSKDWINYNKFLKVSWEQKYSAVIADYLPAWKTPGPVWVTSAYGTVPSGAVAAGIYDNEVIWVARAMHRYRVLPATLLPSKHCCLVFADGQIHRYNKYQVMCNAEVRWAPWRGGSVDARAVSVAAGIHVGRVLYHGDHLLGAVHGPNYHCHVVIFGRPFAFNCYELLMLAGDEDQ